MAEPAPQNDDAVELDALERLIRRADGFALAFARVNSPVRRRELADDLRQRLGDDVRVVDVAVPPKTTDLQFLLDGVYSEKGGDGKVAFFVTGIERVLSSVRERTGFLPVLNFKRENLQRSVPAPVVLWMPEFGLRHIARGAPDFWAWRSGVFEFSSGREDTDRKWKAIEREGSADEHSQMTPDERVRRIETLEALYAEYDSLTNNPATLVISADIADRLGRLYRYVPDLGEAMDWSRQALRQRDIALGPNHPDTLGSASNLGSLLLSAGELDEAEQLLQQSLANCEHALGPDHEATLATIYNLSCVYSAKGDRTRAEPLAWRAFQSSERALGVYHPNTILSAIRYGNMSRQMGYSDRAEVIYREAMIVSEQVLGIDHPTTLMSVNNLGNILRSNGNLEEAEQLHRRALDTRERILGTSHPYTLSSMNNLANLLQARGDLDEAERLFRQALDGAELAFGSAHSDTKLYRKNLNALLTERHLARLGDSPDRAEAG